jgi:hypothetical protein
MKYIKDEKKIKIAEFLFDYAYVDMERDCVSVPLFRVLDALLQDGEPYSEGWTMMSYSEAYDIYMKSLENKAVLDDLNRKERRAVKKIAEREAKRRKLTKNCGNNG